jgi:hypothetical protein
MGQMRNAHKNLLGMPEWEGRVGRPDIGLVDFK